MNSIRIVALCFVTSLLGIASAPAGGADEPVDFAREILPILSNKCFVCHGPDIHHDTDLRLD
jgi:hypothetical protein